MQKFCIGEANLGYFNKKRGASLLILRLSQFLGGGKPISRGASAPLPPEINPAIHFMADNNEFFLTMTLSLLTMTLNIEHCNLYSKEQIHT